MTGREEFDAARAAGIRKRHAVRLARAAQQPCSGCQATATACETKRWLAGRPCCERCGHTRAAHEPHAQED